MICRSVWVFIEVGSRYDGEARQSTSGKIVYRSRSVAKIASVCARCLSFYGWVSQRRAVWIDKSVSARCCIDSGKYCGRFSKVFSIGQSSVHEYCRRISRRMRILLPPRPGSGIWEHRIATHNVGFGSRKADGVYRQAEGALVAIGIRLSGYSCSVLRASCSTMEVL